MLDLYFTVDVEVWCNSWRNLDRKFPQAFQRYVYGHCPEGDFGLPYQLRLLSDYGLKGVFFVEPLFATRFGDEPLGEIVGLIKQAGHEVQLHLHTEWVDEACSPLLDEGAATRKRKYLREFSVDQQTRLIEVGRTMLRRVGGGDACAFRAGGFGFNADTLVALTRNGIPYDASYNGHQFGRRSGVAEGRMLLDVTQIGAVQEIPMTVFRDGLGRLRHAQLGACSQSEIEALLWQAVESERQSFVILSHNFELLRRSKRRADHVVIERFGWLCSFLDKHRDVFRVRGFRDGEIRAARSQPGLLTTSLPMTMGRLAEQVSRRFSF